MEIDQELEPARSMRGWVIFVTGLHEETTEEQLMDKFADYGKIKNVHLNLDRKTGLVKGYALIEFQDLELAQAAIDGTNDKLFLKRTIHSGFCFIKPT